MSDREQLLLEPAAGAPQVGLLIAALPIHHLVQHEAEHRAHIALIRDLLAAP